MVKGFNFFPTMIHTRYPDKSVTKVECINGLYERNEYRSFFSLEQHFQKKDLHIYREYVNIVPICKMLRLGCLVLVCVFRESGRVESAYVQCRAFSQELPPEHLSRAGRVMPLPIMGVDAPESGAAKAANCGWYRGRIAFRPDCSGGRAFLLLPRIMIYCIPFRRKRNETTT